MSTKLFGLESFAPGVSEQLGNYVYALCRADGSLFYIGRGVGNRVFQHAREALKLNLEGISPSRKHQALLDQLTEGTHGHAYIVKHGLTECEACALEAIIIAFASAVLQNCLFEPSKHLTNVIGGSHADGLMIPVEDMDERYGAEYAEFGDHRLLLLSFNTEYRPELRPTYRRQAHLHFTHCWVLNERAANRVDYVVAVAKGVVRSVCRASRWFTAKRDNGRLGLAFEGMVDEELSERWVGKRLPAGCRFAPGQPVRYWPPRAGRIKV
jgi:uncharacterized protein